MSSLKEQLSAAMKEALKAKDKERLGVIRLLLAAIKQVEVDSQKDLEDAEVLAILDKQAKQRRDSQAQYLEAGREDLAQQEAFELSVIESFLPEPLDEAALSQLVQGAIDQTGASTMADMGQVMAVLKPQVQGRADMGEVSRLVRAALS